MNRSHVIRSHVIRARIRMMSTSEGGRKAPAFSGYRPALYFGKSQTDGAFLLEEGRSLAPGEEAVVAIRLLHPQRLGDDALQAGASFDVKEGTRLVARGKVVTTEIPAAVR